jgi:RNA-directed DNA polymerase
VFESVILWLEKTRTRRKKLMGAGLHETTASLSAYNGHGAWRNSGASHMNLAFKKKYFDGVLIRGDTTGFNFLKK